MLYINCILNGFIKSQGAASFDSADRSDSDELGASGSMEMYLPPTTDFQPPRQQQPLASQSSRVNGDPRWVEPIMSPGQDMTPGVQARLHDVLWRMSQQFDPWRSHSPVDPWSQQQTGTFGLLQVKFSASTGSFSNCPLLYSQTDLMAGCSV